MCTLKEKPSVQALATRATFNASNQFGFLLERHASLRMQVHHFLRLSAAVVAAAQRSENQMLYLQPRSLKVSLFDPLPTDALQLHMLPVHLVTMLGCIYIDAQRATSALNDELHFLLWRWEILQLQNIHDCRPGREPCCAAARPVHDLLTLRHLLVPDLMWGMVCQDHAMLQEHASDVRAS